MQYHVLRQNASTRERQEPETELVVLGNALYVEQLVFTHTCQLIHHAATQSRPDARGGNRRAQALTHQQILGMVLSKLVQVRARCPVASGHFQRDHGELHHVLARDKPIKELQLERVDDIFRVMHDDDLIVNVLLLLDEQHPLENPVQAVGLVCRSGTRADDLVNSSIALAHRFHRQLRGLVVGIRAHENVVVAIVEALERVQQHLVDYFVLVPGWNPDGGQLLRDARQVN